MFRLQDKHCKESHYKILSFLHMSFLKMEQKPAKKITEHWTMFNTGKQTCMQNLDLFWQCSVLAKNHCIMWAFNFLQIIEKNVSNWFIVHKSNIRSISWCIHKISDCQDILTGLWYPSLSSGVAHWKWIHDCTCINFWQIGFLNSYL